jgi:2-C-methyl-D-erythritol 4-phosphate cytidylyltransferase/2-C-methyl-D-erythritol 2,4-cyclodiphosphate synthase
MAMTRSDIETRPVYCGVGGPRLDSRYNPALVHVSAIIAAGGRGQRFGAERPKQLLTLGGVPILQRSVEAFAACELISSIVVTLPEELAANPPPYLRVATSLQLVTGGARRQDSVRNGFAAIADRADVVVVHDAARPLVTEAVIRRTIQAAAASGAAIAAVRARDTVKRGSDAGIVVETLRREEIYLAQTPQAFRTSVLRDALAHADALAQAGVADDATDEAALAERAGHQVRLVDGDPGNLKITTPDDLVIAERLVGASAGPAMLRIGNGYDLHRLVPGRPLILGGVTIPFDKGLQGHSDADAVCHAVTDAILGAAGAGDIGRHFPDSDAAWKDANSIELLRQAALVVRGRGYLVVNVDVVVIAQRPTLAPFVEPMRSCLAAALGCEPSQISVKGKTNEGVDSMGAGESVAVHAVALLMGSGVI